MLEQYYTINKAAGINIDLFTDQVSIDACGITVNHNQLYIETKVTELANIEDLTKHFVPKTPIALNLTGKGILQKQISRTEEIDQQNFSKILPNASLEDFYVQNFISGEHSFVSAIRKTEADKWIVYLNKVGFVPIMLSLGPFPVQNVLGQTNFYDSEVVFNGYVVHRDEQSHWTNYDYKKSPTPGFPIKIESENIDERLLIPYAVAFQLVMSDKVNPICAHVPALRQTFLAAIGNKKIKVYGVAVLVVFFAILLLNFFLYSWLNSSNAKLTEQVSSFARSSDDVHKTAQLVQQKEVLLKILGWEGSINKSWMIDQVAALVPPEVTWRETAIDPVDASATRLQKSIVFFDRQIRIMGDADKIIPVNEWIARVKAKSWVKNAQLDSYTFNSELNTGQFIILIDY